MLSHRAVTMCRDSDTSILESLSADFEAPTLRAKFSTLTFIREENVVRFVMYHGYQPSKNSQMKQHSKNNTLWITILSSWTPEALLEGMVIQNLPAKEGAMLEVFVPTSHTSCY